MKTRLPSAILLFIVSIFSCEESIPEAEKVIRLKISNNNILSTTDSTEIFLTDLIDFNKADYPDADSMRLLVIGGCCQDISEEAYEVSLFDLTNNVEIANSTVTFDIGECTDDRYSGNVKNDLPAQTIDLGVKTNGGGVNAFISTYLYIYR